MLKLIVLVTVALGLAAALPSTRIINGRNANPGEYPFIVSLRRNGGHFCGGSIIESRWVLTAAHCLYNHQAGSITVHAGILDKTETGEIYNSVLLISNEHFNYSHSGNDTALIKVDRDFAFRKDYIEMVELDFNYVMGKVSMEAIGWGVNAGNTNVLQELDMRTLDHDECRKKISKVDKTELCMFDKSTDGMCFGDSGSPLVNKVNGQGRKQVGIASWVVKCAGGFPDVYTRVSEYKPWIINNIHKY